LIGYFEGIDSERGIAWRAADSLVLRDLPGMEPSPDGPGGLDGGLRVEDLESVSIECRLDEQAADLIR
jgi:hypothetical protein